MAGLDSAIHVLPAAGIGDVDTRAKRGHGAASVALLAMRQRRLCRYAAGLGLVDRRAGCAALEYWTVLSMRAIAKIMSRSF
jgi:hypothetical protein